MLDNELTPEQLAELENIALEEEIQSLEYPKLKGACWANHKERYLFAEMLYSGEVTKAQISKHLEEIARINKRIHRLRGGDFSNGMEYTPTKPLK
jgi:hypothetical protein